MSTKAEPLEIAKTEEHASQRRPTGRSFTWRAFLLGTVLLPANAYWVVQMESVRYSAHPTTIALFFNCIFLLVVLAGANSILRRVCPRCAFSQGELLLVYSMLCIGSCMASHDFAQILVPSLSWPYYQANSGNGYAALFWRFLPKWAMMSDTHAAKGFWLGNDTFYTREHLVAWLPVVAVWTAFTAVLLWVMQCVNVVIRKQWTEY